MIKKNILFIASGNEKWIAELYYLRNIMYAVLQNEKTEEILNIYLLTNDKNLDFFKKMIDIYNIKVIKYDGVMGNKKIINICKKYSVNYIFPITDYGYYGMEDICVYWIPDFQHKYLNQYFSNNEINRRDRLYSYIAKSHKKLVLSSESAYSDYKTYFPECLEEVYVVPFVSYIEDEIKLLTDDFINLVKNKYQLPEKYFYIANQFWMHKNHKVAFEAINILVKQRKEKVSLICTGYTEDYRNKDFFVELENYIEENDLKDNINIVGFISRKEQLAIMKKSICLIQPSLFEGWGTGVEDAKVLDKDIILSDIPVHYEQKNNNCLIFDKHNSYDLAEKMLLVMNEKRKESINIGLEKTKSKAKEYSNNLLKVFDNGVEIDFDSVYNKYRSKLKKIFGDTLNKNIGIYGTGEHTESMLNMYIDLIGNIDFNLYFFDSDVTKWGEKYFNSQIYSPKRINDFNLDSIVISSYSYQEEIYSKIKYVEKLGVSVIKVYEDDEKIIFLNW